MSKFQYQAFDGTGCLLKGELDAASEIEARDLLWQRGATAFEIKPASTTPLFQREFSFSNAKKAISDAQLASLANDLAILVKAFVPLDVALRIVAGNNSDPRNRSIAEGMLEEVLRGSTFASALERLDGAAHEDCIRILEAGELAGSLGSALQDVAELLARRLEIRQRIRAAMAYPILLICLAAASLFVVIGLLLPSVTPIFAENGMPLPTMIAFLNAIRAYALEILAGCGAIIAALFLLHRMMRRNPGLRIKFDRLWLKLPIFGPISRLRDAARLARTLTTLLKAGVPLLQAFGAALMLVNNRHMRSMLEVALLRIREGASLARAITESDVLPSLAQQMVAVGEETGRLNDMLQQTASIFERQEQDRTAAVIAAMTPAITVGIAALVAGLIISIMSAIMSINDLVLG
jgi:general secretion pathway protein F